MQTQAAPPSINVLSDIYGRTIRKLRVSLTDACNYRCFYCMPSNPTFLNHSLLLTSDEYFKICSELARQGITQIRVTGGEPTVRKEFAEIISRLGDIADVRLSLTSNGEFLEQYFDLLWDIDCRSLNISMDSLDPGKFARITRGGNFEKVEHTVFRAAERGFVVKINCVVFRDINSNELIDFHNWSAQYGIEVRFLEFMKIGPEHSENFKRFISADEMIDEIEKKTSLHRTIVAHDSTSIGYLSDQGALLGFIASETKPFCGTCSRLRLSASGDLRSCLMSEAGVNIRHREIEEYPELLEEVIAMKPIDRIYHVDQAMHEIGG